MTDKATHTPLPWTAERDLPHNRMPRVHSSADGSLICECGNMGTTPDQWEANAAFIVLTVNSHHDLIEALKIMRDYGCPVCNGDCGSANPPVMFCPMQMIDAILTKAEAGR